MDRTKQDESNGNTPSVMKLPTPATAVDPFGVHSLSTILPVADKCIYTSCFCEENVWKLCDYVRRNHPGQLGKCYCVFISNQSEMIPLWKQRGSQREDRLVIWDYHVIFVWRSPSGTIVYDLDSELPFECDFMTYVTEAVQNDNQLKVEFRRQFRTIPAADFLEKFASDRSHMVNEDGSWKVKPPTYPCIRTAENVNNIKEFISMDQSTGHGKVLSYDEFVQYFQ